MVSTFLPCILGHSGTNTSAGNVPVRRDIRDLKDNFPDQWNLYLRGLDSLQRANQNDSLSFYRIAGVHGRPYKVWENAPGLTHKVGTAGYCPHGNSLFFGWHRPYLALFEQELYKHIQRIALGAPADQRQRYSAAANSFRIPYWDWGLGDKGGPVPDFFMTPAITIVDMDRITKVIRNPLYSYKFHPLVPGDFDSKWAQMNETVRWPQTENDPSAPSRNYMFAADFVDLQRVFLDGLEKAFRETTYNSFGQAIEEVHGWIHGTIGGGYSDSNGGQGHMWPLDYSSYEPLFWLHHANVDRLFALYQAQDPTRYLTPQNIFDSGNVFLEDNTVVDGTTPLLPFRRNATSFWTTNDARNTAIFGYAYPETQPWNYASSAEYRAAITATISRLYGGSVKAMLTDESDRVGTLGIHAQSAKNTTFTDWTITTKAAALDLPPTFVARFSLAGDNSSDPVVDVGMWTKLMPMDHNRSKRKIRQTQKKAKRAPILAKTLRGNVGLTASLLDQVAAGKLASLNSTDVVPYLRDRLVWKVYSGNGTAILQSDLEALTVLVVSVSARIPDDHSMPIEYSDKVTVHADATAGKTGGAMA
ncbi:tyrosinase [Dothidotthia symphoricarpi CBS 119687]|uniref:tyrosinase n=1 Tax=Dothidotthia symphoricarpi CBS 119687 TaxID=1392245 RepID=A0A6A6AM28_9PLEO|nr:tyrosinase [Dothidotthia symphoricarpi CBS 119687]KAF2133032.1 tyrosinase [Dothidotthia symphoricarpi CBS 119687]